MRNLKTWLGLSLGAACCASPHLALSQAQRCFSDDLKPAPPVVFEHRPSAELRSKALIPAPGELMGWLEVEYDAQSSGLRFYHKLPELGLALNVIYVEVQAFNAQGERVFETDKSLPAAEGCGLTSLFPGQHSKIFLLNFGDNLPEGTRLMVKVFLTEN